MAREFRMRLPSAREWGGIAFFITEEELKRFDLSMFNLSPTGFTWEGTPFRLEEGKAVYYWSSDSDCDSGMARALHIVKGKVDIEYRPVGQGMNLRFLLDS